MHPHHGILLGNESNELYASIWMSLQGIILSENSVQEDPDQDGNIRGS